MNIYNNMQNIIVKGNIENYAYPYRGGTPENRVVCRSGTIANKYIPALSRYRNRGV